MAPRNLAAVLVDVGGDKLRAVVGVPLVDGAGHFGVAEVALVVKTNV